MCFIKKCFWGFSDVAEGTYDTLCQDKMLFLQKDVLGKGFTSNSWKAIYSIGRKVETLNLAVGEKKLLSLENCMEKKLEGI